LDNAVNSTLINLL